MLGRSLGPNTSLLANIASTEENTYIDSEAPNYTVSGFYVPQGAGASYVRGAQSTGSTIFEGRGGLSEPGTLSSARSDLTLAHEMLHRLQDVRPVTPDAQFESRMTSMLEEAGWVSPEGFTWEDALKNPRQGARTEILPHILSGLRRSRDSLLDVFNLDREALRSRDESGRSLSVRLSELVSTELERLYLSDMTRVEYERASRLFGLGGDTGRGRATVE